MGQALIQGSLKAPRSGLVQLQGGANQRGIFTESEEGFEVLGTKWRAVLDFGCGVLDYTGLVMNAGA